MEPQFSHEIARISGALEKLHLRREMLTNTLTEKTSALNEAKDTHAAAINAREFAQAVAKQTQSTLEYNISSIVTAALEAVFPDPYEFKAEFEVRRNKTECMLWFVKNGAKMRPMDCAGGGPIDVASFALRLMYWTLNKTRPIFVLDEPFKFVSVDLQPKCSEMLKMMADKLGIQIVMISHLPEIIAAADKIFVVEQKAGISTVREKI
jgi:DNA repair exonuclease SbcCD ATPase subunit